MTKCHFLYGYTNCLRKLDQTVLTPTETFYSPLKNNAISSEYYALCQTAWSDDDITTMRDSLIMYNNFLDDTEKQFDFHKQRRIDMFKGGINVSHHAKEAIVRGLPSSIEHSVPVFFADMSTGWYMRRREETEFHPHSAHQYIHMAVDWFTWEAAQTGKSIRYHFYG